MIILLLILQQLVDKAQGCSGGPKIMELGEEDYCKNYRCYRGEGDCDCDAECAPYYRQAFRSSRH